jgi:hypothetical protein
LSGDESVQLRQFRQLADRLWDEDADEFRVSRLSARRVLASAGAEADFIAPGSNDDDTVIDYIHRRTNDADIYFVASRLNDWHDAECSFRIAGKQPELWDPVSGKRRDAAAFSQARGRTIVPLRFPPNGSMFVVFRRPIDRDRRGTASSNRHDPSVAREFDGSWQVTFDVRRGGPAEPVVFKALESWTAREEPEVRHYSGPAVYRTTFDLPETEYGGDSGARWWLDLGEVKEVAAVRLNRREVGIAWTEPFLVELTDRVQPKNNQLEIEVTNLWPNRLIGDQQLPVNERITRTNINKFRRDSPLLKSGLFGPIRLLVEPSGSGHPGESDQP